MNRAQRVIACLFLLPLILLAACSRTAPGSSDLTVSNIEAARGSLLGGTEVTIRGEGLFEALSGAYRSDLSVSICGAPLTDLQLIDPEEKASVLPGGGVSKLLVGSGIKGVTSAMTDSSGDARGEVVVTRPDGQTLTLEDAFDCYPPAPVAAADTFDVLGNVNIDPPAASGLLANDSGHEIQVVSFGANAGTTRCTG